MKSAVCGHQLAAWASAMARVMHRRGPDGHGLWVDEDAGLVLAHNRLAIRDRSAAGSQPMLEPSKGSALVFNGEIDNHRSWRDQLTRAGHRLGHLHPATGRVEHSSSDTESLLHALHHWGPSSVCRQSQGMWAWGWYERDRQRLTLSRDRIGKKPLYWLQAEWGVAFASQLQAFRCLPMYTPSVNQRAVAHYLRWGFMEGPDTLLNDVHRVEPGQIITIEQGRGVSSEHYWTINDEVVEASRSRVEDPPVAQAELLRTLELAISDRMSTDVATGAFLSGGIDSTLVVALMQKWGAQTRTWCVGFDEATHDESDRARAIASALGTRHETVRVGGEQAARLLPELAQLMDEPLADASLIPSALLAERAAPAVKVVLTGDGGDECFGGYERYRMASGLRRHLLALPPGMRRALASGLDRVEPRRWEQLARAVPATWRPTLPASKAHKLASWLRAEGDHARWQAGLTRWDPALIWTDGPVDAPFSQAIACPSERSRQAIDGLAPSEKLQRLELAHYLCGDLLAKMDRATMWSSLEARSPLLDHRVVSLAWRCTPALKAEGPRLKELLRSSVERYVARDLIDFPKRGFTPPLSRWLRSELREPGQDLLESLLQHTRGAWNEALIRQHWRAHQEGTQDEADRLWTLLTLEMWRRDWGLSLV